MSTDKPSGPKDSTHEHFNKAHDGKVLPEQSKIDSSVTKQQQRSGEKLEAAMNKPASRGKAGEVASAKGAFHFNVEAVKKSEKSVVMPKVEPKKEAQKKRAYISKANDKTYHNQKAIETAKALDKAVAAKKEAQKKEAFKKEEQKKQAANKARHHAPAAKLPGGPRQSQNGVSGKDDQAKKPGVVKSDSYYATLERVKKNTKAKQDRAKAQEKTQEKTQGKSPSNDNSMER